MIASAVSHTRRRAAGVFARRRLRCCGRARRRSHRSSPRRAPSRRSAPSPYGRRSTRPDDRAADARSAAQEAGGHSSFRAGQNRTRGAVDRGLSAAAAQPGRPVARQAQNCRNPRASGRRGRPSPILLRSRLQGRTGGAGGSASVLHTREVGGLTLPAPISKEKTSLISRLRSHAGQARTARCGAGA